MPENSERRQNSTAVGNNVEHEAHAESIFDALGNSYSDVYEHNATHLQCIKDLISLLEPGSFVLDVGSGTGRPTALLLTEAGFKVTGIDISSVMVEAARQNVPGATFMLQDCLEYEPPKRFDAVVSTFALTQLPTSQIRKIAYKMSSWLKPGGYLLFGAIDYTGIVRESDRPIDHTGEAFYHLFMNRVIKDNLFSVGDWVNVLRQAGIVLREANGALFDMEKEELSAEPECFLLGRKVPSDALLGPHKHPYDHFGDFLSDPEPWKWLQNRWAYKKKDTHPGPLSFHRASSTSEEDPSRGGDVNLTWALDGPDGWNILDDSLTRAESSGEDVHVRIVQAAPYNDVINIVNRVLSVMVRPQQHHGAILNKARDLLVKRGYEVYELEPLNGHVQLYPTASAATGAEIFTEMWFYKDSDKDFARKMLKFEFQKYLKSLREFGGRGDSIGFDSVLLTAKRKA